MLAAPWTSASPKAIVAAMTFGPAPVRKPSGPPLKDGFSKPAGRKFPAWVVISVVVAAVAIVTGLSLYDRFLQVRDSASDTKISAIAGKPCPTLSHAAFVARHLEAPQVLRFNDLTFARRFGFVSCGVAAAKGGFGVKAYSVCQFTSPDVLVVTTAKGTAYFEPGIGQKASLMLPGGDLKCVMAAPDWD